MVCLFRQTLNLHANKASMYWNDLPDKNFGAHHLIFACESCYINANYVRKPDVNVNLSCFPKELDLYHHSSDPDKTGKHCQKWFKLDRYRRTRFLQNIIICRKNPLHSSWPAGSTTSKYHCGWSLWMMVREKQEAKLPKQCMEIAMAIVEE